MLGDNDSTKPQIALLFDDLLPGEQGEDTKQILIDRALKDGYSLTDSNSQFKYLDLINENDGDVWVSTNDGSIITIYWPCPDGVDINDFDFKVLHFKGLHREYRENLENQINAAEIEEIAATADGTNLVFTLKGNQSGGSFSPFALAWTKKSGGGGDSGGGTTYYTLRYESNGGTKYKDERYKRNTVVELDKVPTRESYIFTGWYVDKELTERITEIKMTSNKTVYAGWEPTGIPDLLNGEDHFVYVVGYPDGTVRPLNDISRAEVAVIIFRLLDPEIRDENLATTSTFEDVDDDMWCSTAISTLARLGIVCGRTPEMFDPNAPITRAEFATICARFDNSDIEAYSNFTDIDGHWAERGIERAATLGWISGYTDGTFRPNNLITRAETMTMINRVLRRLPEDESDLLPGMKTWPDNQPEDWFYLAVQEATNSHDFKRKQDGVHERWTSLTVDPDWPQSQ